MNDDSGERLFYIIDEDAAEHIMSLLWSLHETISAMLVNREIVVPRLSARPDESAELRQMLDISPKGGLDDIF